MNEINFQRAREVFKTRGYSAKILKEKKLEENDQGVKEPKANGKKQS